jgi:hypothetical protein
MWKKVKAYLLRCALGLDMFANVLTGGHLDETISSRVRRASDTHPHTSGLPSVWIAKVLNSMLNDIQADHGHLAEQGDLTRAGYVQTIEQQALKVVAVAAAHGVVIPVASAVAAVVSALPTQAEAPHEPCSAAPPASSSSSDSHADR